MIYPSILSKPQRFQQHLLPDLVS